MYLPSEPNGGFTLYIPFILVQMVAEVISKGLNKEASLRCVHVLILCSQCEHLVSEDHVCLAVMLGK